MLKGLLLIFGQIFLRFVMGNNDYDDWAKDKIYPTLAILLSIIFMPFILLAIGFLLGGIMDLDVIGILAGLGIIFALYLIAIISRYFYRKRKKKT